MAKKTKGKLPEFREHDFIDRHGTDVMGSDEDGVWFGTEDQPVTLHDRDDDGGRLPTRKRRFVVNGYLEAEPFVAYVRASSLDRTIDYFRGWGVRELEASEE